MMFAGFPPNSLGSGPSTAQQKQSNRADIIKPSSANLCADACMRRSQAARRLDAASPSFIPCLRFHEIGHGNRRRRTSSWELGWLLEVGICASCSWILEPGAAFLDVDYWMLQFPLADS